MKIGVLWGTPTSRPLRITNILFICMGDLLLKALLSSGGVYQMPLDFILSWGRMGLLL